MHYYSTILFSFVELIISITVWRTIRKIALCEVSLCTLCLVEQKPANIVLSFCIYEIVSGKGGRLENNIMVHIVGRLRIEKLSFLYFTERVRLPETQTSQFFVIFKLQVSGDVITFIVNIIYQVIFIYIIIVMP